MSSRIRRCSLPLLAVVAFALLPDSNELRGDDCEWCRRAAVVTEESDHRRSVTSRLVEVLTTPCFHLQNKEAVDAYREWAKKEGQLVKPSKWKPPEYTIHVTLEEEMEGPVTSRLTVGIYYAGEELVKEWTTEQDRPPLPAHFMWHMRRMFDNDSSVLRNIGPIERVLWDFEKTPVTCNVEPEKEEVNAGEEIDVKITGLKDGKGRASREFNRILVNAKRGEIVNGVAAAWDPSVKVFSVGNGDLNVRYKASEECEFYEDIIHVYNSCEINKPSVVPLSMTELKDKIGEASLDVICLKGRVEATLNPGYTVPYVQSYEILEERSAELPFRLETTDDPDVFDVVSERDFVEGKVKTKRVTVVTQGRLTMDAHEIRTRAIQLRVPEGDVDLNRRSDRVLYFHIDLRVYDPETKSWSTRPVPQGPVIARESLSETDWWFAHQFWTPVVEDHMEDVGVYRYRMHLNKETVDYLNSER